MPEQNGRMKMAERVWDVLMKVAVPLSIMAAGAMVSHEVRISRIEDNRFTDADGLRLKAELKKELPPEYLIKRVDELLAYAIQGQKERQDIRERLAVLESINGK